MLPVQFCEVVTDMRRSSVQMTMLTKLLIIYFEGDANMCSGRLCQLDAARKQGAWTCDVPLIEGGWAAGTRTVLVPGF